MRKVCVFGAGAVGGHLAALLAGTDADVSVVVRGAALDAIRRDGLRVLGDGQEVNGRVRASDSAAELGVQDLVFVTVKSTALPAVAATIAPLLGLETAVVFLMNGIPWWYFYAEGSARNGRRIERLDPGARLWSAVDPQRVIGAVSMSACTVVAPGVVDVKGGNRSVVIGEPDGRITERVLAIQQLLQRAGFPTDASPRIRNRIWSKLMLNLGSGALGVLAPVALKELYAEPACVAARMQIIAEVAAIAAAMGCPIDVELGARMESVRSSPHKPSIAQDVLLGRPLEIDALFTVPLELARECGVATPTLDLLIALGTLKAKAAGLYPPPPGTLRE